MKSPQIVISVFLVATALMSGCANTYSPPSSAPSYPNAPSYSNATYGVIDAIEITRENSSGIGGSGIGAGAVIGGVVGGVLGHQVGEGRGKDVATVAGVVGGAMAGHQIEKSNRQQQDAYRLRVRLDNGGYQTVTLQSIGDLRVGDRVRVENDSVSRY